MPPRRLAFGLGGCPTTELLRIELLLSRSSGDKEVRQRVEGAVRMAAAPSLPRTSVAVPTIPVVQCEFNVVLGHLNREGSGERAFAQKLSDRSRFVPSR